jgi:N utilization substance protein A
MTGIVRRFERGNIVVEVDNGKAEALLPQREQVPRESLRPGDRIVAYVKDVDKSARGPQIILSRTHRGWSRSSSSTRCPRSSRASSASRHAPVSPAPAARSRCPPATATSIPVGACVGIRGSRVQAVVQELRGEKIDIVPYNDDPARFVCNAIQPATVSRVLIDAERHTMELVVPDDKLSLAIGKKGQNVRLASKLTGWRIDIYSESKLRQMERAAWRDGRDPRRRRRGRQRCCSRWVGETSAIWRSPTRMSSPQVPGIGGLDRLRPSSRSPTTPPAAA